MDLRICTETLVKIVLKKNTQVLEERAAGFANRLTLTSFVIIGSLSDLQLSYLLNGIGDIYPIQLLQRVNEIMCVMCLAQCLTCRFSKF